MDWPDTSKLHQFRYVVNPYLRHLKAQGVLCPTCASKLYIKPSAYNPDVGMWVCPRCGCLECVLAPEYASMPMDEAVAADEAMAEDSAAGETPGERHEAERKAAWARRSFRLV